jgi:hypothetical protein
MDRLEHYRQIVRTFIEEYAQESVSPNENVTAELVAKIPNQITE